MSTQTRTPPTTAATPVEESIARHHAYLVRMVTEGVAPAEVSALARKVWELARKAVPNLPVPAAATYDGGPMHDTWDNCRVQVPAEVPADGPSPSPGMPSRRSLRRSAGGIFPDDGRSGADEDVVLGECLRPLQLRLDRLHLGLR